MTRPKRAYPVSSYGPELMAALVKANREPVTLDFPNRRIAAKFQLRINQLRAAMRGENHPDYPFAARVVCSLLWGERIGKPEDPKGEKAARIILKPRDSEFSDVLKNAGVDLDAFQEDSLAGDRLLSKDEKPTYLPNPEAEEGNSSAEGKPPRDFLSEAGFPPAYPDEKKDE